MTPRMRTGLILVATFCLLMLYDLIALLTGWGDTISQTVHGWIQDSPVVALLIGMAVAHVAWPIFRGGKKETVMESKPPENSIPPEILVRLEAIERVLRLFSITGFEERLQHLNARLEKLEAKK